MEALVANRGVLLRALNVASGKTIGQGCQVKRIPVPTISDQEIPVKVHAVALNPVDFKSVDLIASRDSIIGCDYAGEVADVGKNAPGGWKVGDRIAGFLHGGIYGDRGSFCNYLKVDGDLAWRVPDGISDEEASTYGVPAATAMLALNVRLSAPWLDATSASLKIQLQAKQNHGTILIYAGSTSVGLFAIQLAESAGYTLVTTASPHSFDLVKKYGTELPIHDRSSRYSQGIPQHCPSTRLYISVSLNGVLRSSHQKERWQGRDMV
ncbi:chaperonin 10-like protein [Lipomyces starkeyi]